MLLLVFIIAPDMLWAHAYKYVAPYFVAGYYYAKRKDGWLESNKVGIAAVVMWLLMMLFYSKDSYIYTTGITIFHKENVLNQLIIDAYRYLVGAAGVIASIHFLKKLFATITKHEGFCIAFGKRLVEYMGRNSITFYILSTYLFAWILPEITKRITFNFVLTLLETTAVALLCDAVGKLLKRSRVVSKWLIAS